MFSPVSFINSNYSTNSRNREVNFDYKASISNSMMKSHFRIFRKTSVWDALVYETIDFFSFERNTFGIWNLSKSRFRTLGLSKSISHARFSTLLSCLLINLTQLSKHKCAQFLSFSQPKSGGKIRANVLEKTIICYPPDYWRHDEKFARWQKMLRVPFPTLRSKLCTPVSVCLRIMYTRDIRVVASSFRRRHRVCGLKQTKKNETRLLLRDIWQRGKKSAHVIPFILFV